MFRSMCIVVVDKVGRPQIEARIRSSAASSVYKGRGGGGGGKFKVGGKGEGQGGGAG